MQIVRDNSVPLEFDECRRDLGDFQRLFIVLYVHRPVVHRVNLWFEIGKAPFLHCSEQFCVCRIQHLYILVIGEGLIALC